MYNKKNLCKQLECPHIEKWLLKSLYINTMKH